MEPPKPLKECKCGIVYEGKSCPGCGATNAENESSDVIIEGDIDIDSSGHGKVTRYINKANNIQHTKSDGCGSLKKSSNLIHPLKDGGHQNKSADFVQIAKEDRR